LDAGGQDNITVAVAAVAAEADGRGDVADRQSTQTRRLRPHSRRPVTA
jgi:hypothetical protein